MKKILLPCLLVLFAAACNMDGDGNDANDSTENAFQRAGDNIEEGVENLVDSAGPKIDRAADRVNASLEKAEEKLDRAGERIGDRISDDDRADSTNR